MKDWNSRITELVVLVKPMLREMSRPLRIMAAWKILTKRLEMSVLPTEMFAFTLRPRGSAKSLVGGLMSGVVGVLARVRRGPAGDDGQCLNQPRRRGVAPPCHHPPQPPCRASP